MMKKPFGVIYCAMIANIVYSFAAWDGWNVYFYFMLPFAMMGLYIISVAFISGDKSEMVQSAPFVPKFMKKALTELGVSFKRDFPILYYREEAA